MNGLGDLGNLSSLISGDGDTASVSPTPFEIPLDKIDEDPDQPRTADNPGFSKESLSELAASIKARSVKTPISVRDSHVSGRYIINHGARRYRASELAGRTTIPGFVDNDYTNADQVVENLQRNALTPREIADFIGRELAGGKRKKEIATALSKSPAWITQHTVLLDLPDCIAAVFNSGDVQDVTAVNELVAIWKKDPEELEGWLLDDSTEITRGSIKQLKDYLEHRDTEGGQVDEEEVADDFQDDESKPDDSKTTPKEADPEKLKKAIVFVLFENRQARLILNKRPEEEGWAWIKFEDSGEEMYVDLGLLKLSAIVEG